VVPRISSLHTCWKQPEQRSLAELSVPFRQGGQGITEGRATDKSLPEGFLPTPRSPWRATAARWHLPAALQLLSSSAPAIGHRSATAPGSPATVPRQDALHAPGLPCPRVLQPHGSAIPQHRALARRAAASLQPAAATATAPLRPHGHVRESKDNPFPPFPSQVPCSWGNLLQVAQPAPLCCVPSFPDLTPLTHADPSALQERLLPHNRTCPCVR